jgi:DNA-binding MarR family transcriptional regulator
MKSIIDMMRRANQNTTAILVSAHLPQDLSPRQYDVLEALSGEDGVSQTRLVEITSIDRSTIVGIIERLVEKGLIQRARTADDRRVYAVTLTPKGQSMIDAARPVVNGANERVLSVLPDKERAAFLRALERLADVQLSLYTPRPPATGVQPSCSPPPVAIAGGGIFRGWAARRSAPRQQSRRGQIQLHPKCCIVSDPDP